MKIWSAKRSLSGPLAAPGRHRDAHGDPAGAADLACTDFQQCATRTFLEKIKKLDPAALRDLVGKELTVLSALEVPGPEQHEIQTALEERLGAPVPLQFATPPAMAWGIELRGNGRRIGWTPDSYIESLEENLKEALERRADLVTR